MLTKTISSMYKKIAMFGDIHYGCRGNDIVHNKDCLTFIEWFTEQVKITECDCIIFLGDFWENRSALNVGTINYGLQGLRMLNELNIPIYFIVGNHDLFFRNNRNMHSIELFREFNNVHVVDTPLSINDELLILPYLFKEEYVDISVQINQHKFVFGHLEFKNFYLTGASNQVCEHGFLHKLLNGPKYIFSGHFHKRQCSDNIIYIGNPFGTNYGDVNDYERGMCILDVETEEVDFLNYDGPSFFRTSLSKLAMEDVQLKKFARVKCLLDLPEISYSEAQLIKKEFMEIYELREFILEQNTRELQETLSEVAIKELDDMDLNSIDESIKKLIVDGIDKGGLICPVKLVEIYGDII